MSLSQTPRLAASVGIFLVSLLSPLAARDAAPPPDLAKRVAQRAEETRRARDQYTYRQTVIVEELKPNGARVGEYREVRDVIFSPKRERIEQLVGRPVDTLQRLRLTEEDFQDIREVQPFLFDASQLWFYETRYRGEENVDDVDCWVLQVRPRQILANQRLFDGLLWVSKNDYSIVRTVGKAVPDIRGAKTENLFPRFTTIWQPVEGGYRFPVYTYADDTLDFRVGPQRIRLTIRYSNYKRFSAESTVKFAEPEP